jgi:hypothetical protein
VSPLSSCARAVIPHKEPSDHSTRSTCFAFLSRTPRITLWPLNRLALPDRLSVPVPALHACHHCLRKSMTMPSSPNAQQLSQLAEDSFMQVDEPDSHYSHPSTPTRHTLPSTKSTLSISDATYEFACDYLEHRILSASSSDQKLGQSMNHIWFTVHDALQEDPVLKPKRANQDEFKQNVKQKGQQQFFTFLREMAETKSWDNLLQNGTFPFL